MGQSVAPLPLPRRGVSQVLAAGVRFGHAVLSRRARLGVAPATFVRALWTAVRPHFFVFPCAACLAGAASRPTIASGWRVAGAAVAVGVAWGVGQLLNDLVDLEADAVDAPGRPAVMGLLPEGPTALVASLLGLAVAGTLALVHPLGWLMAALCALLMLAYAPAKALPALGNLMHGALMATLAAIGVAVAEPRAGLAKLWTDAWPTLVAVGALSALYLQGNYEKDRAGDARAGYRTLAHVLGERGSALARGLAAALLYVAGWRASLVPPAALWLWGLSAGLLALSVAASLGARPLGGYRFTVHSTATALVALAWPALGSPASLALLAGALLLIELAFVRSDNP